MIDLKTFTIEHIKSFQEKSKRDPELIERTIFALGLLEAIIRSGLKFIFKGGTSLLLLLEEPRRFSTDIDIVVDPGTDVEKYLNITASIWPFINIVEQIRNVFTGIEKRHFKFSYTSPLHGNERTILLDILFEENPYSTTIKRSIETELLITDKPLLLACIPNTNCIIADKLTAFAPNTTGIKYNIGKELEIIKQLYDVASLLDGINDFNEVKSNFEIISATEIKYRNINVKPKDVLRDTINTTICIASRGLYFPNEFDLLKDGIRGLRNFIFIENFTGEIAVQRACMVLYLAAAILTNQNNLPDIKNDDHYKSTNISSFEYNKLSSIKKTDMLAYKYLFEAVLMLS